MHSENNANDTPYILSGAGSNIRVGEMEENIADGYVTNTTQWWAEVGGFTVHSLNTTHTQTLFVSLDGSVIHTVFRARRAKAPNCGPTCSVVSDAAPHEMRAMAYAEED